MLKSYLTVAPEGTAEVEIQKSRFIGHVKRCESEEEAVAFIQLIKKQHHQANHNCSCYLIGEHDHIQKANDDGEPSGTAGVPMLDVLKKRGLKDVCVVITRYFGGIKLGAGGLIRAYAGTTSEALNQTGIVERKLMKQLKLTVAYTLLGKVENALRQQQYRIHSINYLDLVHLHVYVEVDQVATFTAWVIDLTSDQAQIEFVDELYLEQPIS
ncbi:uncharacterized protein, YigZ family [Amphibacillus marinus]|uniref:Uncharacterized protein, YigZ family n=1 Tax=Amphibacillus marinus TaxID=872970 RepID=A0A1H8QXS9_9BACI|nr:YigZ family protein [Amphibacillus marinus]SEO58807.1 uncharacterized protein, YigZ family [Amphibacillus marinus]